ncbi:MAG: RnfABCDGE type electron transport complex subunit D [Bacteroidales bacterium]|nr:RnfABCDGE type electron transport complex subunit D [Bacteroidales bacterium]MCF8405880.1 RnfABCDGE type electron transport complex subunit D [Bacteroidales bacterium]
MSILTVSPSPHIQTTESVPKLMYGVIIALIPAFLLSTLYFGLGMLVITLTAVVSSVIFEYLIQKYILKVPTNHLDGSAALTGLLLAFCLPANLPIGLVLLGSLFAIGVGKMTFGGLGNNPFNPALLGRVFLFISFPVAMTNYPKPGQWMKYLDAESGATPLSLLSEKTANGVSVPEIMSELPGYMDMFLGKMLGSAGEVAAIALLLGLVYMLWRKIITWHIPVSILLTVAVFTGALFLGNGEKFADPLFHLLTGGLLLGAIFMATDYVTSPMSKKGMLIYGVGIGVLTVLIRVFGAYPEGVQFAILLMNGFTPLINKYVKPKRFGEVKNG